MRRSRLSSDDGRCVVAAPLAHPGMYVASGLMLALAACGEGTSVAYTDRGGVEAAQSPSDAEYLGVETRLLSQDLVNIIVTLRGPARPEDVDAYARCAAAQYTLIRGYGFARHVRTSLVEEGSLWQADAVYTISPSLPRGTRTIDAAVTVEDCKAREIPTV